MTNPISPKLQNWIQKVDTTFQAMRRKGYSVHGVKPFYTNIRAFDANRSRAMVLGINPGGNSSGDEQERLLGYTSKILDPLGNHFCSIITGPNGEQAAKGQRYASRMREYLSSLFGWPNPASDDRRFALLPIGNLVPFRSPDSNIIEDVAWNAGVDLGLELIEISRPKLLLLIGTGENRSCWGALKQLTLGNTCKSIDSIPGEHFTPYAKAMSITWVDTNATTDVLAIPHPNFQITNELYNQQIQSFVKGYSDWKLTQLFDPYKLQMKAKLSKPNGA